MDSMDLWEAYEKLELSPGFQNNKASLRIGTRWGASLEHIEDRSFDLKMNQAKMLRYDDASRYLLVKNLSFDLFVSAYDVNTRSLIGARMSQPPEPDDFVRLANFAIKQGMKNIEIRVIGMQNGSVDLLTAVSSAKKNLKGKLMEVDLFGNETRNIAIDAKTGVSYNLLLLNRIYRPGELINAITAETFEKSKSKLLFV